MRACKSVRTVVSVSQSPQRVGACCAAFETCIRHGANGTFCTTWEPCGIACSDRDAREGLPDRADAQHPIAAVQRPRPHRARRRLGRWARPCHTCARLGSPLPARYAPGLGSPVAKSAPGLGVPLTRAHLPSSTTACVLGCANTCAHRRSGAFQQRGGGLPQMREAQQGTAHAAAAYERRALRRARSNAGWQEWQRASCGATRRCSPA